MTPTILEDQPVASTEEILGQYLGDESFPVHWDSEVEKDFFWVYDDLHIPHPVSPMFFDIGGWWLSCDHMFRRFGTPFAVDWLAKNVNGYVYTTAIPADPDVRIEGTPSGGTAVMFRLPVPVGQRLGPAATTAAAPASRSPS